MKRPYMAKYDSKHEIITTYELPKGAVVHRFRNRADVPYSAIYVDGEEIWSCERDQEAEMIFYWIKNAYEEKRGDQQMNDYEHAVKEIEISEFGFNFDLKPGEQAYYNGAIGQIAIANAINHLARAIESQDILIEGIYSALTRLADNTDLLNVSVSIEE